MKNHFIEQQSEVTLPRRALVRNAAMLAGGAVLSGAMLNPAEAKAHPTKAPHPAVMANANDLAILNFALGLEFLEQEFYGKAALADTQRPYLHERLSALVPSIRDDETAHISAITATITKLGGTPVGMGTYNFPADVFESPIAFTRFAAALEEIGIGAYLGALSSIDNHEVRKAAAAIYGVEARHASLLRLLGGEQFTPRYYEGALSAAQVTQLVAPYIISQGAPEQTMSPAPAAEPAPAPAPAPAAAPPATTSGGNTNGGGIVQPPPAPAAAPAAAS